MDGSSFHSNCHPITSGGRTDNAVSTVDESETRIDGPGSPTKETGDRVIKPCTNIFARNFFSVDNFKSSTKYYFLTNAERACNEPLLSKNWKSPIYCSEETAKVLPLVTRHAEIHGIGRSVLKELKVGERTCIEPNFYVTAIKSHYCPGSTMFLFEGATVPGSSMLCTGPFRADEEVLAELQTSVGRQLQEITIGTLFFDNTDIDRETLPAKSEIMDELAGIAVENPNLNIVLPLDAVGHDDVLQHLHLKTGENVIAYKKRSLVHGLFRQSHEHESPDFYEVEDPDITRRVRGIHVTKRTIRPKTWTVEEPFLVMDLYRQPLSSSGNCNIHLYYPGHSSLSELKTFLSMLKYDKLVPTVKDISIEMHMELVALSRPRSSMSLVFTPFSMTWHVVCDEFFVFSCSTGPRSSPLVRINPDKIEVSSVTAECSVEDISDISEVFDLEVKSESNEESDAVDDVGVTMHLETQEPDDVSTSRHPETEEPALKRHLAVVNILLKPKNFTPLWGGRDLSMLAPPIRLRAPSPPKKPRIVIE